MKCAVKDCTNHAHEGKFIGLLCSPCHNFIAGERGGGRSQACRNTQYKIDEAVKAEREACAKVCETEGSVDDLPEHYADAIRSRGEVQP
jgi:hypothetical protein